MPEEFDLIIIGGGPTGEHAAARARRGGLSVALVESDLIGGECSYWACMPSKTLLRPGQALADARIVPGAAGAVTGSLDVAAALARRDWMVSSWSDQGQVDWLEGTGATLVRGHGRLVGERRVTVESGSAEVELVARRAVIIAVGSSAAIPPIAGLAGSRHWTNHEATAVQVIPRRFLVLGGGVVGVELAQAYRRLGSAEVTILEAGERLVMNTDPFVGELLARSFAKQGIDVRTNSKVAGVRRSADDAEVTVTLEDGQEIVGDELLVATGRRLQTRDIGLESFGLEAGRAIPTNTAMQVEGVASDWLYAIGDASGKALLTHMGKYQARIAVDSILGIAIADEADSSAITGIIFTDPEIGTVGMSETQARAAGLDVRVVRVDLSSIAAASIWGEECIGSCQLVVDAQSERPIGATFVGPTMGDAIHAATIAVVGGVSMRQLRHAVPSFPSLSEIWLELVEAYFAS